MSHPRACLLVLLGAVFSASLAASSVVSPQPSTPAAGVALAGAKLFRRHCMDCHGQAGEGGDVAPSLRTPGVLEASPRELFSMLTNGNLRRGMPSWSHLPDERRWQLVTYIKSLAGPRPGATGPRISGN